MPTEKSGVAAPNLLAVSRPRACPPVPCGTHFDPDLDPSMTKQAHAGECDINAIMARYQRTGAIDHFSRHSAEYGDVPAIDFQEAAETVRATQELFAELPSNLRQHFNQSPHDFLAFVQDPENIPAMRDLGLIEAATAPTVSAPPVGEAPSAIAAPAAPAVPSP